MNFFLVKLRKISVFAIYALPIQVSCGEWLYCKESRMDLEYNFGEFISIEDTYADVELFVPILYSEKEIISLNVGWYQFDNRKCAANIGLCARKCINEDNIVGINAYYDYLRENCHANFNRIGVGIEWFNIFSDMRINAYLPTWNNPYPCKRCVFDQIGQGFFAAKTISVSAYRGFDAELGKGLWKNHHFKLYGAAGTYYFNEKCLNSFWGGMARIELNWKSLFFLKVRASYDHVYHTNIQATVGISIPLDFSFSKWHEKNCSFNLRQPIQRIGIILTDRYCHWTWNWDDERYTQRD